MLLEICVGSLADARAAAAAGADRVELCGALELGGLTPSLGVVEQVVREVPLPVVAMIRPRAGGFGYSPDEYRAMLRDAELALAAGAAGIVFGALNADAAIDRDRVAELVRVASDREAVFHRAFDFVPDKPAALELLIDLGVTRVLTTGGGATALDGLAALRELNALAAGRLSVMPGGGVDAANVARILAATGCAEIHSGASGANPDDALSPAEAAGLCDLVRLAAGERRGVDGAKVAALRRAAP